MVFGTKHESVVVGLFQKKYPDSPIWTDCGTVVNKNYPWFGYSADAFITISNETRLLEAKCPKLGKTCHGLELFKGLPYVNVSKEGVVTLKEKHPYFGQVQLGMALCNLEKAHFLIYVPCINDVAVIDVPLDRDFVRRYTSVLFDVYFDRLLPFLVENSSRLRITKIEPPLL